MRTSSSVALKFFVRLGGLIAGNMQEVQSRAEHPFGFCSSDTAVITSSVRVTFSHRNQWDLNESFAEKASSGFSFSQNESKESTG